MLLIAIFVVHPYSYRKAKSFAISVITYPSKLYSNLCQHFRTKTLLIEENAYLKKSAGQKTLQLQRYDLLKEENERLRALLELDGNIEYNTVSSQLIGRNPARWLSSIIIDKGSYHGISEDSAVTSPEGLIGRVGDVYSRKSEVMLITHPSFTAGGVIKRTGINGIVSGTSAGEVVMQYIPLDADLKIGDQIHTSRYSAVFPEGILIGTVKRVEKSARGLSHVAYIEPSAELYKTQEFLCITKG